MKISRPDSHDAQGQCRKKFKKKGQKAWASSDLTVHLVIEGTKSKHEVMPCRFGVISHARFVGGRVLYEKLEEEVRGSAVEGYPSLVEVESSGKVSSTD